MWFELIGECIYKLWHFILYIYIHVKAKLEEILWLCCIIHWNGMQCQPKQRCICHDARPHFHFISLFVIKHDNYYRSLVTIYWLLCHSVDLAEYDVILSIF
uniref:Uncharacterized protein n=1 Tax=Rhizophora mucronata TaxID=61149 RepID=A0A2P2NUA3_RHIMU